MLEYLGRYTHRVAISNERIVGVDDREVRLRVRDSAHGKRILGLPAATFIDRFLRHVLPKGFKRIRHYGLLGSAGKAAKLAQARATLSVPAPCHRRTTRGALPARLRPVSCQMLDSASASVTIPITTATPAVQSNGFCPPPWPSVLLPLAFSGGQTLFARH